MTNSAVEAVEDTLPESGEVTLNLKPNPIAISNAELALMTIGCAVPERAFGLMFLPTVFFTMLLGTFTGPIRGGLGGVLLLIVATAVRAVFLG